MTGQAALVTGSSRGIGKAAAMELASEGFAIAVNGPADDDELKQTVEGNATAQLERMARSNQVLWIDLDRTDPQRSNSGDQ